MSLDLKEVSYRQHVTGSWFFIHPANLCLLTEEFNLFTFKVITDQEGITSAVLLFVFCMPDSFFALHLLLYCLPLCLVPHFDSLLISFYVYFIDIFFVATRRITYKI